MQRNYEIALRLADIAKETYDQADKLRETTGWEPGEYFDRISDLEGVIVDLLNGYPDDVSGEIIRMYLYGRSDFNEMVAELYAHTALVLKAEVMSNEE